MRRLNEISENQQPSRPLNYVNYYPAITSLECSPELITAHLDDGRVVSVPIAWFASLRKATIEQLNHYEIAFDGEDITGPELDVDVSVKSFLSGLGGSCC